MSLKAIAKELGLSVTTVSRALNGYDDVSSETRARVEAEAQRRGYRPNTFARRLKMGQDRRGGAGFSGTSCSAQ
ncbi:LacI family transcriptional regulator [Enterobacter cloacae]|uniref:LacI family transcriptional regulator n=1 Tax=Enterobacter cloacae TaxID=550 RepID=A0A377LPL0_ENTCL|nr:LacI family transcriptional regulator [Enterobacter cloacae]